jgi:hypothetical protein
VAVPQHHCAVCCHCMVRFNGTCVHAGAGEVASARERQVGGKHDTARIRQGCR